MAEDASSLSFQRKTLYILFAMWPPIMILTVLVFSFYAKASHHRLSAQVEGEPFPIARALVKRIWMAEQFCTARQERALLYVLDRYVVPMARAAARAANPGPGDPDADYFALKFLEHFATTDQETRHEVSRRFRGIAEEASRGGRVLIYCDDSAFEGIPEEDMPCDSESHPGQGDFTFATSNFAGNYIVLCEPFWKSPGFTRKVDNDDRASTLVHELSHMPPVFEPITEDYGVREGHPDEWGLTPEQARIDAYTHQRFAKAIFVHEPPREYPSATTTHSEGSGRSGHGSIN